MIKKKVNNSTEKPVYVSYSSTAEISARTAMRRMIQTHEERRENRTKVAH